MPREIWTIISVRDNELNRVTVDFLQELWKRGEQSDRILELSKNATREFIEYWCRGPLRPETMFLSERAREQRKRLASIMGKIDDVAMPTQLDDIMIQFCSCYEELKEMQTNTVEILLGQGYPLLSEIELVPKHFRARLVNVLKKISYAEMFRIMVFSDQHLNIKQLPAIPDSDAAESWVEFYSQLEDSIHALSDREKDGRWAYELQTIDAWKGSVELSIQQYVSVAPRDQEWNIAPGDTLVSVNGRGEMRMSGRGRITNLKYDAMERIREIKLIEGCRNISFCKAEAEKDPKIVLDGLMKGADYLVDPKEYFQCLNLEMILCQEAFASSEMKDKKSVLDLLKWKKS